MLLYPNTVAWLVLVWNAFGGFVDSAEGEAARREKVARSLPRDYVVQVRCYATPEEEAKVKAAGGQPVRIDVPISVQLNERTTRESKGTRSAIVDYSVITQRSELDDLTDVTVPVVYHVDEGTTCEVALTANRDILVLDVDLELQGIKSEKVESKVPDRFASEKKYAEKVRVTGQTMRIIESVKIGHTISAEFDGWVLEAKLQAKGDSDE